jgi:phytoene synthase
VRDDERRDVVRRIARDADPDRAIATLFAPAETRADLFALFAFNAELARIADQVSEPGLGAIRLQWWREAIERAASGDVTGNPVADAFGEVLARRTLSRERIAGLIDARSFDVGETVTPRAGCSRLPRTLSAPAAKNAIWWWRLARALMGWSA